MGWHQVWSSKLAGDHRFMLKTVTVATRAPLSSNPDVWAARKLGSTISGPFEHDWSARVVDRPQEIVERVSAEVKKKGRKIELREREEREKKEKKRERSSGQRGQSPFWAF